MVSKFPQRRRLRLYQDNYHLNARVYFVTLCVQNQRHLFGEVNHGRMDPNEAGEMIVTAWRELPQRFPGVELDVFQLMPNHHHGIVRGVDDFAVPEHVTLPHVIRWFKSVTTKRYARGVLDRGWERFSGKFWQRGYHDRIIRDIGELERIQTYIQNNPLQWTHRR